MDDRQAIRARDIFEVMGAEAVRLLSIHRTTDRAIMCFHSRKLAARRSLAGTAACR
jgi:hypothetical protein